VATPVSAQAAATRHITVSAEGTVKVAPDAVRLTATVSVVAPTNKEALAATSTSAAAVRKALIAAKIATKDIATQNFTWNKITAQYHQLFLEVNKVNNNG
jgi:uncharacterized protein YggE